LGENVNTIKKNTEVLLNNKKKIVTSGERERKKERDTNRFMFRPHNAGQYNSIRTAY
jgi:hypothetical protein